MILSKLTAWVLAAALVASGNTTPMPPKLAHGISTMSLSFPIFGGTDGAQQTAALLVIFAWGESGYQNHLVADDTYGKKSYGAFMIQDCGPYSCLEIISDTQKSSYMSIVWLARSMKYCPEYPFWFSIYASGGCNNSAGRFISKDRLQKANNLIKIVKIED